MSKYSKSKISTLNLFPSENMLVKYQQDNDMQIYKKPPTQVIKAKSRKRNPNRMGKLELTPTPPRRRVQGRRKQTIYVQKVKKKDHIKPKFKPKKRREYSHRQKKRETHFTNFRTNHLNLRKKPLPVKKPIQTSIKSYYDVKKKRKKFKQYHLITHNPCLFNNELEELEKVNISEMRNILYKSYYLITPYLTPPNIIKYVYAVCKANRIKIRRK